ncbi:Alpha-tocopherol transfer protein-like [Melipona quadrifasciata]|uniref:Alpha-tocopherol transfer protein-like n=1 Tax=Melipona quadrifasciata TaxID=166423 RepID=A0A0N0U4S9_9HYME|nr:Alpha-tocopherol transfer protein-like [Melipona quadrifasciata]
MERQGDQAVVATKSRDLPYLKMGSSTLKAELDDGGDFYAEKAKNELRETPEVVEQALKDFKAMLKDEPGLHIADDDEFCWKFLRPCKWYPKNAFEMMKRFYKFKLNNPRYYLNLLPSNEKKVLSSDIVIPLPNRTANGCRLLLVNCGKAWNPKVISTDEIFRSVILSLEAAIAEPRTQIAGIHVILNMTGLTLTHVTHITPSFAASVTDWIQRCLPCRLKGIHIVNQPFIFNMIYQIFKPFLLEKTRKRLHFHGTNRESLLSFVDENVLPVEFGGKYEMPRESIGQGIYDYFCWFEKDFEGNPLPFTYRLLFDIPIGRK